MSADDLIDVAQALCPTGSEHPRRAFLRRSISTAYYAVFTALTEVAARPYAADVGLAARRLIEHGTAREVCERLAQPASRVPWLHGTPTCHRAFRQFAEVFVALHDARHRADYDYAATPSRSEALTAVRLARRGIGSLEAARSACPDQLQVACVAMFASPRLRKRMAR